VIGWLVLILFVVILSLAIFVVHQMMQCPACGRKKFRNIGGKDYVCTNCGKVVNVEDEL
jgi:transposase-like protein